MRWILITVLTFCFDYAKHEIYDGHALFKIKINGVEQMNFLNSLEDPLRLDIFVYPSPGKDASVLVSKEQKQNLLNELLNHSFEFEIETENIKPLNTGVIDLMYTYELREWITLSPTLWAIENLVVNVTKPDLIYSVDWIILPVANPHAYKFSHRSNRFWRKNRATGFFPSVGVDLNRNFEVLYGQHESRLPCNEGFQGSFANSEPETKIISKIMDKHKDRIDLFIDIHSTGNLVFYGWGNGEFLPNVFSLHQIGLNMSRAMDKVKLEWNRNYIVGNSGLTLFPASGLAMDYTNKVGIPYSYVYELPAHRNSFGFNVFLVDPNLVEHFAMETWEGIKVGARNVRDILA